MRRASPLIWVLAVVGLFASHVKAQPPPQFDQRAVRDALSSPPPQLPAIAWNEVRRDTVTVELRATFPSAFETETQANQTVPVWLFLPAGQEFRAPFPAVVVLHYLGAHDIGDERSLARELNARGVAALAIALPYHLSRAPEGKRSGELAITPDPEALTKVMIQGVLDVRRALDQLLLRPDIEGTNLGISGISLGSLVAELAFGVDPRIKNSAFMLGGTGLAHILWRSSLVIVSREALRRKGVNEAMLETMLEPIEPRGYLRDRVSAGHDEAGSNLVVKAKFDTVIPPVSADGLISSLNAPLVISMDTGHYGGVFVRHRIYEEVADFFAARDYGRSYTPSRSLHAPTLRLLAQAATPTGFDIGIGLDVFKTREEQELFGCAAVTPHGPEFIIAKSIAAGFALGASIGIKGPGFGLYWSAVL